MAEYIEREKLLDELGESASYHAESGREYQLLLRDRNIVREQPTADVIERTEFEKVVKSFKTMVEMKNENLIDMRDKYYTLEKEYAELKVNIDRAIEEMDKIDLNEYVDNSYQIVEKCKEILKRNIGE